MKITTLEPWNYSNFCTSMQQFINQTEDKLNRIAFELLDYNSDGEISEVDLFVGLTLQDQVSLIP
jgi:Ca2+-binding EF-hand superfamily protein